MNAVRSVRARITIGATVLVAITLAVASIVIIGQVERDVVQAAEETLDEALAVQAEALGADPAELQTFDFTVDDRILGLGLFVEGSEGEAFGEVYEGGEVVADLFIDLDSGEIVEALEPGTGEPIDDPALLDALGELAFDALSLDGGADGSFLVGATALDEVDASVRAVRQALLLTVPLLTLLFAAMVWWLVGRALRPVHAMTDEVRDISVSNLHRRLPVPAGHDEITDLALVMNEMLDRLESGGRRQRQFSADASHELRSPLTTIHTAAEIISADPRSPRSGDLAGEIVAESERMNDLIGSLLELARGDEAGTEPFTPVDLSTVVATELAAEIATGAVSVEDTTEAWVDGAPGQLRRAVRNLVDNAAAHRTGHTRVQVRQAGTDAVLRVEDDGPGVAEADRGRIFERFARADQARSRDHGGAGLGLALVAGIVSRHHGTVEVGRSEALGGACFEVRLPIAAQAAP